MSTFEIWICQQSSKEEFPDPDVRFPSPDRESTIEFLNAVTAESILRSFLHSNTGDEWFFDPNAPLSLRAVEIGSDRMAVPFATRDLKRDVKPPSLPERAVSQLLATFKIAKRKLDAITADESRIPRARIVVESMTSFHEGEPINGFQTAYEVYEGKDPKHLVRGMVHDIPFRDVANWIHAFHYSLIGRRAELSTNEGEETA